MSQAATKESLAGKIVALNEQFLEHVQRAFARNSASLWLDAVILVRTLRVVVKGSGAY